MAVERRYEADVEAILARRFDGGADYWATPDGRLVKGAPFSTLECALYLLELGMEPDDPVLKETANLIFGTWREDGRFQLSAKGAIYPCQTAHAAQVLCGLGYASDERVERTLRHLLEIQCADGGLRCNKFSFGRGPETEHSNPHPTLLMLNAFRHSGYLNRSEALDRAVEFLLAHWDIKKPIGPCHYGIGTLFMQVEYPFRNYNLFQYVHVLSFYDRAKGDRRFLEAFAALEAKCSDGEVVVERVVPKLSKFAFCKKGETSELATKRYREIRTNLGA
ncbi:prenyltransferase [Oscillospiraceae bacterium OttesenSCG-928-G22]|nr:prenyltransferase [Oscillospiraceae bacterium OttesenSCG-928-G22]